MTPLLKALKVFSLSTTVLGLGAQPLLLSAASNSSAPVLLTFFSGFMGIIALTPVFLNLLTKRYITKLYFDSESKQFTAESLNMINRRRCTTFRACDVVIPAVDGPFTSFVVFKKPFLVDPEQFADMSVYHHLMGYDKPLEEYIADEVRKTSQKNESNEQKNGPSKL